MPLIETVKTPPACAKCISAAPGWQSDLHPAVSTPSAGPYKQKHRAIERRCEGGGGGGSSQPPVLSIPKLETRTNEPGSLQAD